MQTTMQRSLPINSQQLRITRPLRQQRLQRLSVRAEGPEIPEQDPQEAMKPKSQSAAIKDFEKRVDEAGEEISKATQQSSGLTKEATSMPDGNKLQQTMSFSGPGPERINGRLAMVAVLAAFGAEVWTGQPVAQQLKKAPLLVAATFIIVSVASLIPLFKGKSPEDAQSGFWSNRAELWNGRTAMLALVFLLTVETFTGGPAFF